MQNKGERLTDYDLSDIIKSCEHHADLMKIKEKIAFLFSISNQIGNYIQSHNYILTKVIKGNQVIILKAGV